jgi:hypothetical protein
LEAHGERPIESMRGERMLSLETSPRVRARVNLQKLVHPAERVT